MSDEIYHYGVKGMKWGVRRQKKRTKSAKKRSQTNNKKRVRNIVEKSAKAYGNIKIASLLDDIFYGGAGKQTVINAGRAFTTAWLRKHGHTNIRWF